MSCVTRIYLFGAIFVMTLLATGCKSSETQEEITLKRINIVDESGVERLVISSQLPDPVVRGERLERSIVPAGLIWHDEDGNESGGLALAQVPQWKDGGTEGEVRMITFDFTHQITDAVRLGTYESTDGDIWRGGLTVYDRRPYKAGPIECGQLVWATGLCEFRIQPARKSWRADSLRRTVDCCNMQLQGVIDEAVPRRPGSSGRGEKS